MSYFRAILSPESNRLDQDPDGIYQIVFENGVEETSVHAGGWEFEVIGTAGSVRVLNNGGSVQLRKASDGRGRVFE